MNESGLVVAWSDQHSRSSSSFSSNTFRRRLSLCQPSTMASAITVPIGGDLRVDLNISIIDRKPLIVRREGHLVRHYKYLQPIYIGLIRYNRAIRLASH